MSEMYKGLSIEEAQEKWEKEFGEEWELRPSECSKCGRITPAEEQRLTFDCHGIPFRYVCPECWESVEKKGYDGERYSCFDENIEEVW